MTTAKVSGKSIADKVRDATLKALRKMPGGGNVVDLKNGGGNVEAITTGIDVLDGFLIGCGGWPWGRIVEVFGPEASGKSTLALLAIVAVQQRGGIGYLFETEHAFDPVHAAALGVDIDALVMVTPDTLEELLDGVEAVLSALPENVEAVLVWDSVAGTPTKAEFDNGVTSDEGEGMAETARVMSRALRVLVKKLDARKALLVCVNQTRSKVGVVFGNPITTTGGNAFKFYASVRLSLSPGAAVKPPKGGERIGSDVQVSAVKNKVGTPFRKVHVRLLTSGPRKGFDNRWTTITHAKEVGALPEGSKLTDASYAKALTALSSGPYGWRGPKAPPVAPAGASDPDDLADGDTEGEG